MNDKPKRKRRASHIWKWLLGIFLLFVLGTGVFIAYIFYEFSQADFSFLEGISIKAEGDEAHEKIASRIGFSVPDNATDIYFNYYQWQDYEAYIRFSLPADEVNSWLDTSGLCFDLPLNGNNFSRMEHELVSWWRPVDAEIYVTGEQCGNNPYFNILVDQTNQDTWILYIETFTV